MDFIPGFAYNFKVTIDRDQFNFTGLDWKTAAILYALLSKLDLDYEWEGVNIG